MLVPARVFQVACLLPLLHASFIAAQCTPHGSVSFRSPVTVASGLQAAVVSANLTIPRGITIDPTGNILVIERGLGVTAFTESDPSCDGWLRTVVVQNSNLTQGIQVHEDLLYVSTPGEVLTYAYNASSRSVSGDPVTLINGIPPDGELTTRPILLHPPDSPSHILVSSALAENIDPTARNASSGRSQIRSFTLLNSTSTSSPPLVVQDFFSGTLLAFGIRNPAGFAFSPPNQLFSDLWVVDNGASIDNVTGLTATFVNDNPADELNFVSDPLSPIVPGSIVAINRFYGFPDCTTLWNPKADPVGDPQFTQLKTGDQFSLGLEPERNDSWCQSTINNVPPKLSFQAHSVPLDLKFYTPPLAVLKNASETSPPGAATLPREWGGDAFVTFHGSFDRDPPTGYGVVRIPFSDSLQPTADPSSNAGYTFLVQATDLTTCPGTCIRPVGLAFSADGRLFVSSDSSGELFVLSSG